MKKILIYGLGSRFNQMFIKDNFLCKSLEKSGYQVVGFLDEDKKKINTKLVYNRESFSVMSVSQWSNFDIDAIFITSKKYFVEVQNILYHYGFRKEQIIPLDEIISQCMNLIFPEDIYHHKGGIEIGGPSFIFSNIYRICGKCDGVNFSKNTVWWEMGTSNNYTYEGRNLGKIYIADATNLSILDNETYDFVLSSNNLEHIANPIKAIGEFCRILKKNGMLVIAVPMKERTFDHNRNFTTFEHLLLDYKNDIREDDLSHLPEIIELHDYDMDAACGGRESFKQRSQLNFENRCLHHHVFDEKSLRKIYQYFGLTVVEFDEVFGNYLIIGKNG